MDRSARHDETKWLPAASRYFDCFARAARLLTLAFSSASEPRGLQKVRKAATAKPSPALARARIAAPE
jgi:hypothetical protein